MRYLRVLLWVLAVACSSSTSPEDGGDFVSFRLDGQVHHFYPNTDYVSGGLAGGSFWLSASGLTSPSLELSLPGYSVPGTYAVGEGRPGFGRVVVGDAVYQTTGPAGGGSLTISSARCSTRQMYDPVTGITGLVTTCHVQGTFDFVAVSKTGETAAVTQGGFRATSIRGQG